MFRSEFRHFQVYGGWCLWWKRLLLSKCHGNISIFSVCSCWSFLITRTWRSHWNSSIVTILYKPIRLCIRVHILLLLQMISVDVIIGIIAHIVLLNRGTHHSTTRAYPLWSSSTKYLRLLLLPINWCLLLEFSILLVIINFCTLRSHTASDTSSCYLLLIHHWQIAQSILWIAHHSLIRDIGIIIWKWEVRVHLYVSIGIIIRALIVCILLWLETTSPINGNSICDLIHNFITIVFIFIHIHYLLILLAVVIFLVHLILIVVLFVVLLFIIINRQFL